MSNTAQGCKSRYYLPLCNVPEIWNIHTPTHSI